jgi:carbonic anhydrase
MWCVACKVALTLEGGKTYTLAQFHVHTKSEHTIYDHHYSGEIHFVHKEDGGSGLLVTGLLLSAKPDVEENAWIENVWRTMDQGREDGPVPVDLS